MEVQRESKWPEYLGEKCRKEAASLRSSAEIACVSIARWLMASWLLARSVAAGGYEDL